MLKSKLLGAVVAVSALLVAAARRRWRPGREREAVARA